MRIVLLLSMVGLIGCDSGAPPAANAKADALPAELFVAAAPAGAQELVAAKKSAKDGDAIVLRARIGGRKDPIADNRAVMTLTDLSLPGCENSPMDTCPTPWDSCCEPAEEITAKSATIQVAGSDGKPLKVGLNGQHGIAPGKKVVVAGTVRGPADAKSLVVDAKQIFVEN